MSTAQLFSINPFTNEQIEAHAILDDRQLEARLEAGAAAQADWRQVRVEDRVHAFFQMADLLEKEQDRLASLITAEMGKPIQQARAEVGKCARLCRHFAEEAPPVLQSRLALETAEKKGRIDYQPLGGVLGIMPWNYPFWQVYRYSVTALLAGNAAFLKPAPNVLGCGKAIERLFSQVLPDPGLFQTLVIQEEQVEQVLAHPFVRGLALTGSARAGSAVAALAGKYRKKCVLELGGSDPFIVLEDADLESTVKTAAQARLTNNGQTCIAAKRFIVDEKIYPDFLEQLRVELSNWKVGDPQREDTALSTLARADLRENLLRQVRESVEQGARVYFDGNKGQDLPAFAVAPIVLTGIPAGSPARSEELFGPVFSVFAFRSPEEAVHLANETHYGLGASVWTRDEDRGKDLAERIESGTVAINQMVASDPRLPFGGIKDSGFGRELGAEGLLEFVNIKTVVW